MDASTFNELYPVGTPVTVLPCSPNCPDHPPLTTVTRSRAWNLGGEYPVVSVEGFAGGMALSHIDVIDGGESL